MALFNPFCSCLNPKRIVNPYTHECMTVPCGKCKACVLAKNSRYSFQCDLESYCSMYTVFITLTYAPDYLPVAAPMCVNGDPDTDLFCRYDLVDSDTGESLGEFDYEVSRLKLLQQKFNLCGSIPYLRKTDLQLFLKRLRYYVTKRLSKEKVRYYAVGEYGPVHFRPHYHLLLFLNSKEALQICSKAVSEAWTLGRIDVQVSEGKCSSYVASYVNSSVYLPEILKMRSKLTDDQLCSFVKSRFIQSPSELMAWSQYLMNSQDEMIAAAAAERETEQPAPYEVNPTEEP
jgi:hypothetical protein